MKLAECNLDKDEVRELAESYAKPETKFDRLMNKTIQHMEEALERVDSGALVVNLQETLRRGGRDRAGLPALGFATARYHGKKWGVRGHRDGSVTFGRWLKEPRAGGNGGILMPFVEPVNFPAESFYRTLGWTGDRAATGFYGWTTIPVIPPKHRPDGGLSGLLYVWEAQWNTKVPNLDPALLKPIGNGLAEVVAQWDLTPLEAEALRYL